MRGAAMSLSAAASGFVVFLLSVSVVQGQDVWAVTYTPTEICALKGSTVNMRSTYTYPSRMNGQKTTVDEAEWFVNMSRNEPVDVELDPQYSGRVNPQCTDNDCTLRITDLRESDSAEYKFRFITNQPGGRYTGLPGVTLTVTAHLDVQVEVSRSGVSQSSDRPQLKCLSRCPRPERLHYIWYKNGQKIEGQTSHFYSVSSDPDPADSFSCAVEGYEAFSSPPVYGPKLPSVLVSPSAEIVEGSSVTLSCSSDANPAANYTWYKTNGNGVSLESQLVFRSIQSSDSGQYYCTAENELGRTTSESISVDVKYGKDLRGPSTTTTTATRVTIAPTKIIHQRANIIRLSLVVFILIFLLLVLILWMRKKKTLSSTTEAHEPVEMMELDSCPEYENVSDLTAAQTEDTAAGRRGVKSSQVNQRRDSPDGNKAGPH